MIQEILVVESGELLDERLLAPPHGGLDRPVHEYVPLAEIVRSDLYLLSNSRAHRRVHLVVGSTRTLRANGE